MTLRELNWMAQGRRASLVNAARLAYTEDVDIEAYIEIGAIGGIKPLPYSPAELAALAGVPYEVT